MSDQLLSQAGLTLEQLRRLFPITEEKKYFFNGNICPCASPVQQAMEEFLDAWTHTGDGCWAVGNNAFEEAKSLFGQLINAAPDTITGITNTTTGINMAALMVQPREGQNVVVTELEHMSDVYPWLAFKPRGVKIRYVPARDGHIDMVEFERSIDDDTAAVCISHVTMGTGFCFDLNEICRMAHAHGARVVVDGAQSVGAVPINVRASKVDFFAAPTFKWMFGPLGAGFLYVCPELIKACDPPLPGWFGVLNPLENDLWKTNWHTSAHKFERGVPAMIAFVGAEAGLRLLARIGHDAVFSRISELASYLIEGLTSLGVSVPTPNDPRKRAGIVAAEIPDYKTLWVQLENQSIHTGDWLGYLRIDTACYNTRDEIDELLKHIRNFVISSNR